MTKEELSKIPFKWISHLNLVKEYVSIYKNEEYGIELHQVTKKKGKFETGKSKRILFYKGNEYKSIDDLLEAINKEE